MMRTNEARVFFKPEAVKLHQDLVEEGLNSQTFTDFVRCAVHEKIYRIRAKQIARKSIEVENEEE